MGNALRHHLNPLRTFGRAIASVITECNQAQRRMMELRTAPDRYLPEPYAPPRTYAEFLFRTSGLLRHEQSASERGRATRDGARSC